jgi:hypothetical protein
MADHLRTELVLDALDMAITQRNPTAGLVHTVTTAASPGLRGRGNTALLDQQ